MEQPYSASGSDRPVSQGVTSAHVPANESVNNNPVRESTANGTGIVHNSHADIPGGGEGEGARSGVEIFLLATLAIALVGWLVTLISQAVVAATISNPAVRVLWFGFLVQTVVIILVVLVFIDRPAFNAAYAYGTQISVFAAIAAVFAALGVDGNIYSPFAAQQATGAGWLLTAIIDLLWIFFFTSPPSSPALRITSTLGGPHFRRSNAANPVTKISRSTDAFAMGAMHGGNAGMFQGPSVPDQKPMSGHWSGTPARNTVGSIPGSEGNNGLEPSAVGAEQGSGGPLEGTHDPRVSQAPSSLPDSAAKCRAEALFDYKGSKDDPNELAFKKGDTLLIFDMSSKWWEAKTLDGKKGIAPSNYLRVLKQ